MQSTLTVTSASTRRADIQGLRALAVILVVSFHAGLPLPGGFVGVDVFFVISGFVITAMLMREWSKNNSISFKNFYLRRFQRLTPALIVMILVVLAVSAIFQSPFGFQQMTAVTAAGAVLLVANFAIGVTTGGYFGNAAESNPLLNTWSLSVEEQFYIVFPTLLLVGWLIARRHPRFRIAPVALICALGVASLFIAIFGSQLTSAGILPEILTGFYSPLPRAWEFAVGAALAFVAARSAEINRRVAIVAASLGLLLIAIAVWTISPATAFPGPMTIVPVAGTALIIWAGCRSDNPVSEFLGARPFVSLGDISYSLYLWHWPLIVFALLLFPENTWVALVAALISFIPAIFSYRWIEQPIRSASLTKASLFRLVLACTIIPLGVAIVLWTGANRAWASPELLETKAALEVNYESNQRGCFSDTSEVSNASWDALNCTWNPNGKGAPIYLFGDSNALHFDAAVIRASEELDSPLTIKTVSGCPFIELEIVNYRDDSKCASSVSSSLEWLEQAKPGTVILSQADFYWRDPNIGVVDQSGLSVFERSGKIDEYVRALREVTQKIEADGHQVLFVQTVPSFARIESGEKRQSIFGAGDCSLFGKIKGDICVPDELPQDDFDQRQGDVWQAVSNLAQKDDIEILDLRETICPEMTCSAKRGDEWLYWDSNHLTTTFSETLADQFITALRR